MRGGPGVSLSHLAQQEVHPLLHEDVDLLPVLGLHLLLTLPGQIGRALTDPAQHQSVALVGDFSGDLAGLPVDGLHSYLHPGLVAPVDQLVLAGVEGEGLHHVCPGPEELPVELLDGLGLLHGGLRSPGPRLDVASLLQLEHEPAISDDWAGCETLENSLVNREGVVRLLTGGAGTTVRSLSDTLISDINITVTCQTFRGEHNTYE